MKRRIPVKKQNFTLLLLCIVSALTRNIIKLLVNIVITIKITMYTSIVVVYSGSSGCIQTRSDNASLGMVHW